MTAAFTAFKNILNTYVVPLQVPAKAYASGYIIHTYCLVKRQADTGSQELDVEELSKFFLQTIITFSNILEAKRLKIFEGTRWEKPFVVAVVGIAFFNGLVFYKNHFNNPFPEPLEKISRVFWPLELPITGITRLVFTIFEFHSHPKELAICLLGGCASLIRNRKGTSKTVQAAIDKINYIIPHGVLGARFCIGNRSEKVLILTTYCALALTQWSSLVRYIP